MSPAEDANKGTPHPGRRAPGLSVVVIGRNEGPRLAACLDAVNQMYAPDLDVELIYVDSKSTDNSLEVARSFGALCLPLAPVRPTAALGRNAGWRMASAPYVLFLDGDTVLDARFVHTSLPHFEDPSVAIVWGHRRESNTSASLYNRVLDLDWMYPPGDAPFCGGDALFRRDVLVATGGFDETLIAGEEPELCRRITARGFRILHVDRPMTQHDLAITRFSQYWRRALRAGHAYAEVSSRFANTPDPFWLAEARQNRTRALFFLTAFLIAITWSYAASSVLPMLCLFGLLIALVVRTAGKASWKATDRRTLFLYAAHSHLQQIPIFFGQVRFYLHRRRGERSALVEYKR